MKNLTKMASCLILIIILNACHDDNTLIDENDLSLDLSQLKISLQKLDLNKPQVVFSYKNAKEAQEKSQSFIKIISKEIDDLIESKEQVTNVLFTLSFKNSTATLRDIYVVNLKDKMVLNDSSLLKSSTDTDWDSVLNGASCPDGWTDQGTCSGRKCIADTTAQILQDPEGGINSNGDCVEIQYNRGLLSVRICSKPC